MSEKTFAQLLEQHIRDNGYTNYEVAKAARINRVNLQRYLSGARIPSIDVFEEIRSVIPMNRDEQEEFCEAYELAADGADNFYLRRFLRELLEDAGDICGTQHPQYFQEHADHENTIEFIDGAVAVEHFIWGGIAKNKRTDKEMHVLLYLPADQFFAGRFFPTYQVDGDSLLSHLRITQLIPLAKRADQTADQFYNLRVLKNLIPLYFHAEDRYETCYYYHKNADRPGYGAIYPYYAVFENSVIMFSGNMEHAVRIRDQELVKKYREQFLSIAGYGGVTKKLVTFFPDTAGMLQFLLACDRKRTEEPTRYFLEYQPCFAFAADRTFVESVLCVQGPERELLLNGFAKRMDDIRHSARLIHYFTERGLDEFIRTGVLLEYPESYVRPLTVKERLFLIDRFVEISRQDRMEFGMIRDEKLDLKKSINVFLSTACGLNLILYDEKRGLRHMLIDEPSICHAFGTYIGQMAEKREVYSAEETRRIVMEKRERLAEQL